MHIRDETIYAASQRRSPSDARLRRYDPQSVSRIPAIVPTMHEDRLTQASVAVFSLPSSIRLFQAIIPSSSVHLTPLIDAAAAADDSPVLPATVLARWACTPSHCTCDVVSLKAPRAPNGSARMRLMSQAILLPLVGAVSADPGLDAAASLPLAAVSDLSQTRRLDRAAFVNAGALSIQQCSCCYREIIQTKDRLGLIVQSTARQVKKGRAMTTKVDFRALTRVMPDVIKDLLRRFNKKHGTAHETMPVECRQTLWLCASCIRYLTLHKYKSYPPTSMQNNLLLPDVPLELSRLTHYERHLVSRVRSFHQLVYLPFGQLSANGLSISYPSDTLTLVDSLPSTLADSDICIIRQVPDMSAPTKLLTRKQAKEHASIVADQRSASLRPAKTPVEYQVRPLMVKQALVWLVHNNQLYNDLTVSSQLEYTPAHEPPVDDSLADDASDSDFCSTASTQSSETDLSTTGSLDSLAEPSMRIDFVSIVNPVPLQAPMRLRDRLLNSGATAVRQHKVVPVMQMRRANGRPIRINYEKSCEAMAYPGVFPTGTNHYGTDRFETDKLSPLEYFRSRLTAYRERCVRDVTYLFFAVNAIDWFELERQVDISFRQRTGTSRQALSHEALRFQPIDPASLHESDAVGKLTKAQLQVHATANDDDVFVEEHCWAFMKSIRGTLAYWIKCKQDVFSMLHLLGAPTWFVTFSADEFGWVECLMSAGDITREAALKLTKQEKQDLIANNPDRVSRYFDYRWSNFFRLILKSKKGSPIGKIKDHFWRIEFQRRGSPHVHMLLWIEGAPQLNSAADRPKVVDFIAAHISTEIPSEPGELRDLVLRLQQHRHTPTCTRSKARGSDGSCRFFFPRPVCAHSRLATDDDRGIPRRSLYVTKRGEADVHTNAYNPELLLAWKGNMDIQYVSSVKGVVAYVCSYMTKDEPEGYRISISAALAALPPTANKRAKMMRIGSTLLSKRELPAQEACYKLLGMDLRQGSRSFITLNCRTPAHRTRMLKPRWQEEDDNSTDLFTSNPIERYKIRPVSSDVVLEIDSQTDSDDPSRDAVSPDPNHVDWDAMTLFSFAINWNLMSKPPAVINSDGLTGGTAARPTGCFLLQDGAHWIRRRTKPACVQTHGLTAEKDKQDYYYSLLMMHIPFRDEPSLMAGFSSPTEAFVHRQTEFKFDDGTQTSNADFAETVRKAVAEIQFHDQAPDAGYLHSGMQFVSDMNARDLYTMDMDGPSGFDVPSAHDPYAGRDDWIANDHAIESGLAGDDLVHGNVEIQADGRFHEDAADRLIVNPNPILSLSDHQQLVLSLNLQQRAIYDRVVSHSLSLYVADSDTPAPLRLFISGGGGTGKSYLLRAIREHIMSVTRNQGCIVCAPTGVAAFNVGGRTIHGALGIQVQQSERDGTTPLIQPLQGLLLQEKTQLFAHVDYLIIDEISMVSANMLSKIHHRLNQLKPSASGLSGSSDSRSFGNISVIVFGDLYQLKPVKDFFVFSSNLHLWRQFRLCELTANERQSNDPLWCATLNRIRTGEKNANDMSLLRSRLTESGACANLVDHPIDDTSPPWSSAQRIFATNAACKKYNDMQTERLQGSTSVFTLRAQHQVMMGQNDGSRFGMTSHTVPSEWIPAGDDNCGGLTDVLYLGLGSRVMLRRNVSVNEGLVNGATGVVTGFDWGTSTRTQLVAGALPESVLVQFDDERVGMFIQDRVIVRHGELPPERVPIAIGVACSRFDGVGGAGKRQLQRVQMPLMLCWAATIHKVQGITLDRAVIDLSSIISPAAAYVALSRVRTLQGLALSGFNRVTKIAWAHMTVSVEYDLLRRTQIALPALARPREGSSSHVASVPSQPRKKRAGNTSLQATLSQAYMAESAASARINEQAATRLQRSERARRKTS